MKIIKGKSKHKNVPVITLTTYAMKGNKEKFLVDGFNDSISKSIKVLDFNIRMDDIDTERPLKYTPRSEI